MNLDDVDWLSPSETEDQLAVKEVREGDFITVRVPVRLVREDDLERQVVTVELFGQRLSGLLSTVDVVKHEKGGNWPT